MNFSQIKDFFDLISSFFKALFAFSLIVGGGVLMGYFQSIDYYPFDISVGDGLFFTMIAIAFGFYYSLFLMLITSLGLKLRPLWLGLEKSCFFIKNKFSISPGQNELIFTPNKTERVLWFPALLGLWWVWGLSRPSIYPINIQPFFFLLFISWLCAHSFDEIIEISKSLPGLTGDEQRRKKQFRIAYFFTLFFAPLILGGITSNLVSGAMRTLKIRNDNVVVHLKNPYPTYAAEAGVDGTKSAFGDEYLKYEKVEVLFSGLGKYTVLSVKGKDQRIRKIIVPTESAIVIPQ